MKNGISSGRKASYQRMAQAHHRSLVKAISNGERIRVSVNRVDYRETEFKGENHEQA